MILLSLCLAINIVTFDGAFQVDRREPIPAEAQVSGEKEWSYWSYCSVAPTGDIAAFILPDRQEVCAVRFDKPGEQVIAAHSNAAKYVSLMSTEEMETFDSKAYYASVASEGIRPDQVNLPIAVSWDRDGQLYISDNGNRRVSVFGKEGEFRYSFLLPQMLDAPTDVQRLTGDTLLLTSLKLDNPRQINAGYHCNVVTKEGEYVRSFGYTPESAFSQNLWTGLDGHVAVDSVLNSYVAFSNEYVIHRYDRGGELVGTFGSRPGWWVEPPTLPNPDALYHASPAGVCSRWTRVVKLVLFGGDKLLRMTEANSLAPGCKSRFILDVFSTDGKLILGNIASDYWPVGTTSDGAVYFLSLKGDELIRGHLRAGE